MSIAYGVSWTDDVDPWFDGHVAIALTDLPLSTVAPADPTAMPAVPPAVVLLGVSDAAAAEAAIDRIIAEAGEELTFTESEHAGFTIRSAAGSEAGAYALTEDQLIIGSDVAPIETALDTHAEDAGTLGRLLEGVSRAEREGVERR